MVSQLTFFFCEQLFFFFLLGLDDMAKIYITIYFLISVDMNTIKKSLIKTAKNAHNRCLYLQTYEKWICQVYELLL